MKTDPFGYPMSPEDIRASGWTEDRETRVVFPQLRRPLPDEMSDSEVLARYVSPFSIRMDDGTTRDMTNLEMSQLLTEKRRLAIERMESEGCCGEPGHEGRCYGCGGWCPQIEEARQAEVFCLAFLKWLTPKDDQYVDGNDGIEATSSWRTTRSSGQSQTNYDPADDVR